MHARREPARTGPRVRPGRRHAWLPRGIALACIAAGAWPATSQQPATDHLAGWRAERGLRLAVDAQGFRYPASIAFVPRPGTDPGAPLYFVAELHGTVKVVTNDRRVLLFASDVTDYRPTEPLPQGRDSQAGSAGICLAPEHGYVFVTYARRDAAGILRNGIVRFSTEPRRFGVTPRARDDLRLLDEFESGYSHQIGNCRVERGMLHVGIGDGWQPHLAGDPSAPNGKLLRMGLGGEPLAENPESARQAGGVAGHVFALGLRNPFGVATVDGRVFVVDNGTNIDRFLTLQAGRDYRWRGSDQAIALGAEFVFVPGFGPAQLDYAPAAHAGLPGHLRSAFYIAASGSTHGEGIPPGVLALPWDEARGSIAEPPRWIVRGGRPEAQVVAAAAVGPDGIYFAPLMPAADSVSAVLKLVPVNEAGAGRGVPAESAPELMAQSGCLGCHTLNDRWGFGSNTGPPLDSQGAMAARLESLLNSDEYASSLRDLDGSGQFAAGAEARHDVMAASGNERVRRWLAHWIQQPGFDRRGAVMPNLNVSEDAASLIATYLAAPTPVVESRSLLRRVADRYLPAEDIGRRTVAMFFIAGVLLGVGSAGAAVILLRRRRFPRQAGS